MIPDVLAAHCIEPLCRSIGSMPLEPTLEDIYFALHGEFVYSNELARDHALSSVKIFGLFLRAKLLSLFR